MKPLKLSRARKPDEARKAIASAAFRRVLRLGAPATLATGISWGVDRLGGFELAKGFPAGHWIVAFSPPRYGDFREALRGLFHACVSIPVPVSVAYPSLLRCGGVRLVVFLWVSLAWFGFGLVGLVGSFGLTVVTHMDLRRHHMDHRPQPHRRHPMDHGLRTPRLNASIPPPRRNRLLHAHPPVPVYVGHSRVQHLCGQGCSFGFAVLSRRYSSGYLTCPE